MKNHLDYRSIIGILLMIFFIFSSCKNREHNYITYYNKVNEIDSAFRFQKDTLTTIKKYRKLFRKYPPKNQERISEFETFIKIADHKNKKFGGQKSLYKLIPLVAPNWKYKKEEQDFFELYKKYGIDRIKIEQEVFNWKKGLNKRLVDSFSVAFVRDQEFTKYENEETKIIFRRNVEKNAELLKWTFKNYGYPSLQKIGLLGNDDVFMPMSLLFNHLSQTDNYYPFFKTKLLEYVKSGECPPRDYIELVERYNQIHRLDSDYGLKDYVLLIDSARVNHNRENIGYPKLKHSAKITKDFFKRK